MLTNFSPFASHIVITLYNPLPISVHVSQTLVHYLFSSQVRLRLQKGTIHHHPELFFIFDRDVVNDYMLETDRYERALSKIYERSTKADEELLHRAKLALSL